MSFSYATLATLQDANGKNHINGIENFWGYAKHKLAKFKGMKKENFLLHLKECEFRYNTKTIQKNLYQKLLKLIRENLLKILRLLSRGHFDNRVYEVLKNPIISGLG